MATKMINWKIYGNMKKWFQYSVNFKNCKSLVYFQLWKKSELGYSNAIMKNIFFRLFSKFSLTLQYNLYDLKVG